MITTDKNGNFSADLKMKSVSGEYKIWVGGSNINPPLEKTFNYYSLSDIKNAISEVNAAKDNPILLKQRFEQYKDLFGCDFSLYEAESFMKDEVFSLLKGKSYTTVESLNNAFQEAVIVTYINFEEDVSNIASAIEKYAQTLGVSTDFIISDKPVIRTLQPLQQEAVFASFLNKYFTDIQSIRTHFNNEISLIALNTSDWTTIGAVFEYKKDIIGIDINQYYKIKDKDAIDKKLVGFEYKTIESARNIFNQAVREQLQNEARTTTKPSSGSLGPSNKINKTVMDMPVIYEDEHEPVNSEPFTDLSEVEWARESIVKLSQKGIVHGFGNGAFNPNGLITREEFIKMLVLGFSLPMDGATCNFTDVNKDAWYCEYIAAAQRLSLVLGNSDGIFGVGKYITREEMAVLAYRFANYSNIVLNNENETVDFEDANDISDYAKDSVNAMKKANIIKGKGNNAFYPKDRCKRAEAVKIIFELLKLAEKVQ